MILEVMNISFYGIPGKPEERHTPLWHDFWNALACMLKMSMAVVDRHGRLSSLYGPPHPALGQGDGPPPAAAYQEFCSRIPQVHTEKDQILVDPLGMAVIPARLANGSCLLLGCRPGGGKLEPPEGFSNGADGRTEPGRRTLSAHMTPVARGEMKAYLTRIINLHAVLSRCCSETDPSALLPAADLVNEFIALTFDPGYFDLEAILRLIASFLATFTGGGGAFAFSYEHPGRMLTFCSGEGRHIMTALADDWKTLGRVKDPAEIFDGLAREKVGKEHASTFEGLYRKRGAASVYLGLIAAEGGPFQQVLAALAEKAALALKVSLLSKVFQYRWGKIFNLIKQGVIVVDSEGIILMMNHAAKRFLGMWGRMVPAAGQPISSCNLDHQIEGSLRIAAGGDCSFLQECSVLGGGDSPTCLHWNAVPLLGEGGDSAGAVLLFSDITVPVKIHHEIEDWEKLAKAGEVAAGLAHEIRNPLATAKAAIQLIRIFKDPVKQEELLGKLECEMDRMNAILTNFLNITRPQPEKRLEKININDIIHELSFLLNSEALLNEIDLQINLCPENMPAVLGSSDSIKQVLLNIARNAIEALDAGGRLNVSTSLGNGQVHVTLQDNGPGIPAGNMEMLTRPFFTTKPGGTGLGLYISSTIVKTMGGNLEIVSSPGKGTTVSLALPVCAEAM